ncbi:MAG: hypothetical protein FJX75_27400 [Armatimonadetes bacterium]|nr:hypothetical protein [Armatimonadota bacterium]
MARASDSPVESDQRWTLCGVEYVLTSDLTVFTDHVAAGRSCGLLLSTAEYFERTHALLALLENRHGWDRGLPEGLLACHRCEFEFPSGWTASLALASVGLAVHAGRGSADFVERPACPRCGCPRSVWVYDFVAPDDISEADLDALEFYWRELAEQWWRRQPFYRRGAACRVCGGRVRRGHGYWNREGLHCPRCCDEALHMTFRWSSEEEILGPGALNRLRRNPNYFGPCELSRARSFVRRRRE